MNREIHIVCASVPWPLHNRKAIDSFSQIRVLCENDCAIHLHYFCEHKNCHPTELNKCCVSVNRYHIAEKNELFKNLNKDSFPIIMEGSDFDLDLCALVRDGRRIIHRMYDNYTCPKNQSAHHTLLSKISFLRREKTERQDFKQDCRYFFAFKSDLVATQQQTGCCSSDYLPILHEFRRVESPLGLGSFCLYHGDLSALSNEKAVLWLLENVFNDIQIPLIIAGRDPGKKIEKLAQLYSHCCLVADPSTEEMNELVQKAQIQVLPSFGSRHPELKLIHSLHQGRHCIVNEPAVKDTGLEAACHIANNPSGFKSVILQLMYRPFEEEEIELREKIFNVEAKRDFEKEFVEVLFG